MRNITLRRRDVHKGNLILINHKYSLMEDEAGADIPLTTLGNHNYEVFLEIKTAAVLNHLMNLLKCQEEILPVSGYRSYKEQSKIYSDSLLENGLDFTRRYVALPGHSEHQSGLAIDLALMTQEIDFIRPSFPYEGICKLFRDKALLHGFVERYQRGKEAITGIAHEPWHFRYVGYPHSVIMQQNNLALEEYLDMLKGYPYEGSHYLVELEKQLIEIFYIKSSSDLTLLQLPSDSIFQVSGDNMDGFVVTLWR